MQQRVRAGVRRAAPRQTTGPAAPATPKRRVSKAARIFYLMRWTYHFITPIGMIIILWGVVEAQTGKVEVAWPLIIGGGLFTYLANYFNKAR
ncbi:hypothetical protein B6U90_07325 [Thermoplasmatales archaeon ex4484_6]|nr:MAG: hypothetical protein B6U90_07325 [Thermoplasmatales archaeon ex4484_6]RLF65914.1 MAG: hypothetical protein DRN57_08140 [Thermoplasmata archaeon]